MSVAEKKLDGQRTVWRVGERERNAEFKAKERKVALIIDNCPAHYSYAEIENLSHAKIIFLPPFILTHLDQDKPIPKI